MIINNYASSIPFRCFTERRQADRNGLKRERFFYVLFDSAHIRGNHAAIGVSLCGLPESPLREITLEDVSIAAEDPLREEYVEK